MTSNKDVCLALMQADTEAEVITILRDAGHWDDRSAWRFFGDIENNYSSIGNQQSEPVAALIEKLVNAVDARLLAACQEAGIDPESESAPQSVREAVARFFENKEGTLTEKDGNIGFWPKEKVTEEGRLLTLTATGLIPADGLPSLSIADYGEGQEPDQFPDTFLSLLRTNKLRIHFVQGKFNMGGTGALQFCSPHHNLQLIVSRRDPRLVHSSSHRASQWGFTIVRRQWPDDGSRSSVFEYLAPDRPEGAAGTEPGRVLAFESEKLPIFPESNADVRLPYYREADHGSLVKLYEYDVGTALRTDIIRGLLPRIELGLPEAALPIRLFECRTYYKGHPGSFANNVAGVLARLKDSKNLEAGFPTGAVMKAAGSDVKVWIFAFKPDKAKDYRPQRHCVIFAVNGQAHATLSAEFFRPKNVGLSWLADSLLVLVDCTAIQGQDRENLFMNSRDRLRDSPLARQLRSELERVLKDDPTLRSLKNSRREAELAEKLSDSKPLVKVLEDLIRKSPSLAKFFFLGGKVPSPFPPGGGSSAGGSSEFHGKTYPTFFRFKGTDHGEVLRRDAHIGNLTRLAVETDATDDYFLRDLDPGGWRVLVLAQDDEAVELEDHVVLRNPKDGVTNLCLSALPDGIEVGDEVRLRLEVTDPSRIDAFVSEAVLTVRPHAEPTSGTTGRRGTYNAGQGSSGGGSTLQLPNITEVHQDKWNDPNFKFTELTALVVKQAGVVETNGDDAGAADAGDVYDFFVNVDNKFLRSAQKETNVDPTLLKSKFVYGMVLIGIALLLGPAEAVPNDDDSESTAEEASNVEAEVERMTRAIAPVLLPLLETAAGLESALDS